MRLKLFELVDTILEHVGSCGDDEFPLDVRRLELEWYPARAQRGRR